MNSPKSCSNFTVSFFGSAMAVRDALGNMNQHLLGLDLGHDDRALIELITAEVLNNIVEHAYADRTDGRITLWCCQKSKSLHLKFVDEGVAMPGNSIPGSKEANTAVDIYDLPEGGFGWSMIRELTKELAYRRDGQRNILTLRIPLGP